MTIGVRAMDMLLLRLTQPLNRRITVSALKRSPRLMAVHSIVACTILPLGCRSHPTGLVTTGAIVYGTVNNSNGVPAAGTALTADLFLRACPAGSGALTTLTVLSDGSGAYRAQLVIGNVTGDECVHLVASKGSTSVSRDVNVRVHSAPFDSTRVDFILPAGPSPAVARANDTN